MVPASIDGGAVDAGVVRSDVGAITVVGSCAQGIGAVDGDQGGVRLVADVAAVHCNTRNFLCRI